MPESTANNKEPTMREIMDNLAKAVGAVSWSSCDEQLNKVMLGEWNELSEADQRKFVGLAAILVEKQAKS